ncbi:hypothetical protein HU200_065868 [Digitaria exilis]|uniref:Uncharacterized protein n=1 Tax=Digitaria exilis TaxID=1010633 RepID=A0A834ZXY3_9POAL|nr:hypothetical protein HU200_065868 [Digitaria exilis]
MIHLDECWFPITILKGKKLCKIHIHVISVFCKCKRRQLISFLAIILLKLDRPPLGYRFPQESNPCCRFSRALDDSFRFLFTLRHYYKTIFRGGQERFSEAVLRSASERVLLLVDINRDSFLFVT